MLARSVNAALAAGALLIGSAAAHAAEPATPEHGAVVVALGDQSSDAAKPLARDVYRDAALRPTIDDATARILAGEAPADDAPAPLKDLASVRAGIRPGPDDAAARRLLASIGADHHAALVVAVSRDGDHAVARILRVGAARYEPVVLDATTETTPEAAQRFTWPGATDALRRFLPDSSPAVTTTPTAPLAPRTTPLKRPPKDERPFWKSPWFWGPVAAVAAVGIGVIIASQVTKDDPSTMHLTGQVVR